MKKKKPMIDSCGDSCGCYRSYRDNIAIVKLVYPLLFAFVTLILVPSGLMTASSLPEDSYRSV